MNLYDYYINPEDLNQPTFEDIVIQAHEISFISYTFPNFKMNSMDFITKHNNNIDMQSIGTYYSHLGNDFFNSLNLKDKQKKDLELGYTL